MSLESNIASASDGSALVAIEELASVARFSLRARSAAASHASSVLGFELPAKIGDFVETGGCTVLCLGPDEWVVTAPESDRANIVEAFAKIAAQAPHSLTDISDRERSLRLSGRQVLTLLSIGCPRDLEGVAVGRGVRTVFDAVQVVLRRTAENSFEMDVWRSFFPHVRSLLEIGKEEISAGI